MYIQNIPPVLSTPSFQSLIRQDISLNSITDGRVRRRQIQLTNAMTSILLMSLDSRSRHRANPENVMIPSSLTRSLVSHRTGDLFDVMNRNGWLVDHSYSPPIAGGKSFCKSLHIPLEAYDKTLGYIEHQRMNNFDSESIEVSWAQNSIGARNIDNELRKHSFQYPSSVKVKTIGLKQFTSNMKRNNKQEMMDKLNSMLRLSLISDGHGWLKQEFVEAKSGRVYGRGLSNLALTPNVLLDHMLDGCVELDIEACSPRLIPQICRNILGEVGLRFDSLEEYAFRKNELRIEWANMIGVEIRHIKQCLNAILHGCSISSVSWWHHGLEQKSSLLEILGSGDRVEKFKSIGLVAGILEEMKFIKKLIRKRIRKDGSLWNYFGIDEGWICRIKDAGLLAHVYQHEESRILALMVKFLGKNLVVGKHDAVVIKEYGGSLVDQLRNQIRNDLGYELEFGRRNLAGAGWA